MTLIKRTELSAFLANTDELLACHVFLFFGERYLSHEAAHQVEQAFVKAGPCTLNPTDGDQESAQQTLAKLMSFSLLPGRQLYKITDSRLFQNKAVAHDFFTKAEQGFQSGNADTAMRHLLNLAHIAGISASQANPFSTLTDEQWQQVFDFSKPESDLGWADQLFAKAIGSGKSAKTADGNAVDQYMNALTKGLPAHSYLLLTTEAVDKRQRLFTLMKKLGTIVDCTVASGATNAAQKEQKDVIKEMVMKTLDSFHKKIEGRALDMFFERVGFHPVAAVMEAEKLVFFVGERPQILVEDVEKMVGRTREDALYELTDAFGKGLVSKTLNLLTRLQDSGTHTLAILATMRNYFRRLLIIRSLQMLSSPTWHQGMNPQHFQNTYLPELKEHGEWPDLLSGHPYALYMSFTKAAEFSCTRLKQNLNLLLTAEFRIKASSLPPKIILEECFLSMFRRLR